ncbi:hypothetical protein AB0A69_20405 [Streptomyces sp. NPDC045431]|uniref:hypothetical protein n=1 Tax=Streptomyces sp. NPDC045431 TaxID=3155613 RepID=UPI0033F07216
MDIPDWLLWTLVGLAVLQALALVPIVRRMGGTDPAVRSTARFDLLETVGSLLLFGGLLLSAVVTESWFWLVPVGFVLVTAVYAVKGVHKLRARRRPTV